MIPLSSLYRRFLFGLRCSPASAHRASSPLSVVSTPWRQPCARVPRRGESDSVRPENGSRVNRFYVRYPTRARSHDWCRMTSRTNIGVHGVFQNRHVFLWGPGKRGPVVCVCALSVCPPTICFTFVLLLSHFPHPRVNAWDAPYRHEGGLRGAVPVRRYPAVGVVRRALPSRGGGGDFGFGFWQSSR